STLACRVVAAQGIKVVAVKFITPFFGYDLLLRKEDYIRTTKERFAIDVLLEDVTIPYLELLKKPAHGFGRYFNPCIDCKIFLLTEAKKMMPAIGASFLVTGEVIGQRPMSQRRDTLRVIERDSGCAGILVRPLCAKNLEPTKAELTGLIDRNKLYGFSGRNRTPQMKLAETFGIVDYPSPAGGCILADPILSARLEKYYTTNRKIVPTDIMLLLVGRQFRLPTGGWLVVGRDEKQNEKLENLRQPGDWLLQPSIIPGPTAILRYSRNTEEIEIAAAIVTKFAKKSALVDNTAIISADYKGTSRELEAQALEDKIFQPWLQK
ncbi:MAG: thiamine biosynthesis protein, partial [Desulfobacterales bacterium SG8_35_2]